MSAAGAPPRSTTFEIAFLLYPQMTALDLIGPHEVLSRLPGAVSRRVARRAGPMPTDSGMVLHADVAFDAVPRPDILVVPGALVIDGALDADTQRWLAAAHAASTWTLTVCTGALVLAHTGALRGRRATTHWAEMRRLATLGAEPVSERVVRDGKTICAAGVSAGIDGALTLAGLVCGERVAQGLQLAIEYDPAPPYATGSPRTAPPELVERVLKGFERGRAPPKAE
jgi:transcriptional regulator GlxA family with amidase domain